MKSLPKKRMHTLHTHTQLQLAKPTRALIHAYHMPSTQWETVVLKGHAEVVLKAVRIEKLLRNSKLNFNLRLRVSCVIFNNIYC